MSENLPPSGGRLRGRRRKVVGVAIATVASLTGAMLLGPGSGNASSHREAPLIAADPQVDTTDVYAFVSPDEAGHGHADRVVDPVRGAGRRAQLLRVRRRRPLRHQHRQQRRRRRGHHLPLRFTTQYRNPNTFLYNTGPVTSLDDRDLNFYQTYTSTRIESGRRRSSRPGSDGTVRQRRHGVDAQLRRANGSGTRVRAVGGASTRSPARPTTRSSSTCACSTCCTAATSREVGNDTLAGYNVNTIALQVPMALLAARNKATRNPVIGVWSTTSRQSIKVSNPDGRVSFSGPFVSVSRLGSPLVNEVVIPVGQKDRFNASAPVNDAQFGKYVLDPEVPKLIQSIYGIPSPGDTAGRPGGRLPHRRAGPHRLLAQPGSRPDTGGLGDAAAQHVHPTHCQAEPTRCARRRQGRVPERPATCRRRLGHRAAGP